MRPIRWIPTWALVCLGVPLAFVLAGFGFMVFIFAVAAVLMGGSLYYGRWR